MSDYKYVINLLHKSNESYSLTTNLIFYYCKTKEGRTQDTGHRTNSSLPAIATCAGEWIRRRNMDMA